MIKPGEKRILVFDLEVAAYDFESHYDKETKEYLTKYAKDEDDRQKIIDSLVFTPFTSEIIAIGLLELDLNTEKAEDCKGAVLSRTDEEMFMKSEYKNIKYECYTDEKSLISRFWEILSRKNFNLFITFNGREFDCPYILLRSLYHGIKPTYNLMSGTDFNIRGYHIDLMKELTFNKHAPTGARRKFSLDFYCKQLGIKSPKSKTIAGDLVGEIYRKKEFKTIADYCIGDVIATAELFKIWNNILNF